MGRLHAKDHIDNPVTKAKSVCFTPEGLRAAEQAYYWVIVPWPTHTGSE
ncbi:MAG: DUF6429 family protein, partial [Steroidobacteraceae bacterium]